MSSTVQQVVLEVPEEEPVPESDVHRGLVDMLAAWLRARFAHRDDVAVFARLAWFPDVRNTGIRLDPDVTVVFGRPPGPRRSYKAWAEDDVVPSVLLEVWSEDDTEADYTRRLARARRYGVAEAVIVHPFAPGGVRVDHVRADPGSDQPFRTASSSADPGAEVEVSTLGIRLSGGPELRVWDDSGDWRPTSDTVLQLRAERARAEHLAARAGQLADRLRAAGLDPGA